ncbi:hypothetical protein Tco_0386273 [Tanacetum coccineum]
MLSRMLNRRLEVDYENADTRHELMINKGISSLGRLLGLKASKVTTISFGILVQDYAVVECIDYTLWEIIENGNAPIVTKIVNSKEIVIPPTSVEEKAQKRAELKARSTLLLRTDLELISQLKNASGGGGEVSPRKRRYHQEVLESLSQEWTIHTIIWRNKSEIKTLSLDDLFNNLKAYESEVKGTSSSTTNSHNVTFLSFSSTNSATRAVNTAQYGGKKIPKEILEECDIGQQMKELSMIKSKASVLQLPTKRNTLQEL